MAMAGALVGAVDQGTSSSRFLIFDSRTAELVTYHQVEVKQYYPDDGWCEEDPLELLSSVKECIDVGIANLAALGRDKSCLKAIGITNQRETTVVWDRFTGKPLYNAIVWLDGRTASTVEQMIQKTPRKDKNHWQRKCGLPIATYFSAIKLRWLLDNVPAVKEAVADGRCMFGTVDTWLIWNLTGGLNGGAFVTDVTNASRTMLMSLHTLQWDAELLSFFDVPASILPEIRSSAEIFGHVQEGSLLGVPIAGDLGDQHAALVGQMCFSKGQAKNTYGTGCFLVYNTGCEAVFSDNGLLTTIGYKLGKDAPVTYALEGSVAIAGACVRWLRDKLGIINSSAETEALASSVPDNNGCYFVPAFTGLFCPYWQADARGVICGLTQSTTKAHIVRAALEAVCFQTQEVLEAMDRDSGIPLKSLQVDGGMTVNNTLMQLQADICGIPVVRPTMPETTALGAAMAAGHAIGVWSLDAHDLAAIPTDTFYPSALSEGRGVLMAKWKEAVKRSLHWESSSTKAALPPTDKKQHAATAAGLYVIGTLGLLALATCVASSSRPS